MTPTPTSSRRPILVPLVALLGLIGVVAAYLTLGKTTGPAIPHADDVVRLHVHLTLPVEPPDGPLPPPFDAPPGHFAEIIDDLNGATRIDLPKTKLSVGYVEAWYRNGSGVRVELFLVASKDAALTSKNLVLSTKDGVWRRGEKFLDFAAQMQSAYRDLPAEPK